jgi:hypothetical protein
VEIIRSLNCIKRKYARRVRRGEKKKKLIQYSKIKHADHVMNL